MNNIPKLIQEAKPALDSLVTKYRIAELSAFGSITGTQFSSESDIDFLVKFKEMPLLEYADNYFDLQDALENVFNRKVDLVVEESVQNPYLAKSIEATKVSLYA